MQIDEELKKKEEKLEDLLRKESRISFIDKVKNFGSNIKDNAGIVTLSGASLIGAGLVAYCGYEWYQHSQAIAPLTGAHEYLGGLKTMLETAVENKMDITFGENILEPVRVAAEQTAQNYDVPATKELVSLVQNNQHMLQSDNISLQAISQVIGDLYGKTNAIVGEGKSALLGLGTILGGIVDGVGLLVSSALFFDPHDGFRWTDHLTSKKRLKERLEVELLELKDKLRENPNAKQIYDFIDAARGEMSWNDLKVFEFLGTLNKFKDEKYKPVFEAITLHPENYTQSYNIEKAFSEFNNVLKREKLAKQLAEEKEKRGILTSSLYKPVKYSELYLDLLSGGWMGSTISSKLAEIESVDEESMEFFFSMLKNSDQGLFSNILSFYCQYSGFSEVKRLAIAKYLLKKGNRQLAKQLTNCGIYNTRVLRYLENVDELPSVGVRGQVKTVIKLNNALEYLKKLTKEPKLKRLEEVLKFEAESHESLVDIATFLERHPDVPAKKALSLLTKYFFFTQGGRYKSKWVKKEQQRRIQVEQSLEGLLDGKGERKFLEELERKTELARFEAFQRRIDELCYKPLEEILGEEVYKFEGIKITEDLANVILGYQKIMHKDELQPLLRGLLRAHFKGEAQQYLDSLEGNRKLEERVGSRILSEFKKGYSQVYEVGIDRGVKEKLQVEAKAEYNRFIRFAEGLGYKPEKLKGTVKEAERIFKEISQYKTAKERRDFLVEAKHHLSNMKQKLGVVKSGSRKIKFYDSKDPIEAMQMGIVTNSCTNLINDINGFASVVNTIDNNKKVVYMADETGTKVGRTLVVLTSNGLVTYRKYDSSNLKTNEAWVDYFQTYARQVGLPLIVPKCYADDLTKVLKSRGAKSATVRTRMQKAVCSHWYDDTYYANGHGDSKPEIGDKGYKMKINGYVLK